MLDDFITVNSTPHNDPGRVKLRGVLRAQAAIERAQAFRDLLLHLVAVASIPLALVAARPTGPLAGLRPLTLAGWLTCLTALIVASLCEWKYRRKRAALMDEVG